MSIVNSKTDPNDKDYWATPSEIVAGALKYFQSKSLIGAWKEYALDVCASKHNYKCPCFLTEQDNALECKWFEFMNTTQNVAWCNPPYSRGMKEEFIAKAIEQAEWGVETIMLLPNDTSAKWFSTCVKQAKAIAFICDGRISFINNATGERVNGNSAGSILVLFGKKEQGKVARTLFVTKQKLETLGGKR